MDKDFRIEQIVELLSQTLASEDGSSDEETLVLLRKQIDRLDVTILHLLNNRSKCANKIGDLKKRLGMPVYVPERESQVLKNVQSENPGPLQDDAIRRLFERIIDETRSLERRLFQEKADRTSGKK
ncbi:MAG: chorismate mutase [Rhodothermales bacterium]|nr:chorismate mutase [Rhodothermales bacterium]